MVYCSYSIGLRSRSHSHSYSHSHSHSHVCHRAIMSNANQGTAQHHLCSGRPGDRRLVEVVELYPDPHISHRFAGFQWLNGANAKVLR